VPDFVFATSDFDCATILFGATIGVVLMTIRSRCAAQARREWVGGRRIWGFAKLGTPPLNLNKSGTSKPDIGLVVIQLRLNGEFDS